MVEPIIDMNEATRRVLLERRDLLLKEVRALEALLALVDPPKIPRESEGVDIDVVHKRYAVYAHFI